jgi:hypothetical protein
MLAALGGCGRARLRLVVALGGSLTFLDDLRESCKYSQDTWLASILAGSARDMILLIMNHFCSQQQLPVSPPVTVSDPHTHSMEVSLSARFVGLAWQRGSVASTCEDGRGLRSACLAFRSTL